jgi:hypothetical protein
MNKPNTEQEISYLRRSFIHRFKQLAKISRQINALDVKSCNGYHEERAEKHDEKRKAKLLIKAEEIAHGIGLKVYYQGDPRGLSLYLITETEALKGNSVNYTDGIPIY